MARQVSDGTRDLQSMTGAAWIKFFVNTPATLAGVFEHISPRSFPPVFLIPQAIPAV
jgi:hypothetical protein